MKVMTPRASERGEIRIRTLIELGVVFLIAYAIVQIGPAVKLRIDFVNAMEIAANAPIGKTAAQIKMDLIATAEGIGITILSDNLNVVRNVEERRTLITAYYQIHINFWPRFTYVWHVRDQVEAYLL
jgi:hypothetical protein